MKKLRLYLDNSVLNRPFDDPRQPRIWLETVALSFIFTLIEAGEAEMVASEVHYVENDASPDEDRKAFVERCLALAEQETQLDDSIVDRARVIEQNGIKPGDALHLSAAEGAGASHFLTCDDRIIRRYRGKLLVMNPQTFVTVVGATDED